MWLYALTIFTSAFLLFELQPVIAKIILPWFGGSAAVWITCVLFFQTVLLLGYIYAHWSVRRLAPRWQVTIHIALLAASLAALPISPAPGWKPAGGEDPVFRILGLLATSVGLPYFVLSATGPLLQAWYAATHKAVLPYRLFALSNIGSLLALLAYPVAIEPFVTTGVQSLAWSAGFVLFLLFCAASALRSRTQLYWEMPAVTASGGPALKLQLFWMSLAACASVLLLAVTNHLCQNVAAIPFLWILPLALYLLSFILCFDHRGWYRPSLYRWLVAPVLFLMSYVILHSDSFVTLKLLVPFFAAGLFVCCMFCHGELSLHRPPARHLTSFYLMLSLGGALGGLFVAFAAPHLFRGVLELPIGIVGCLALALCLLYRFPAKLSTVVGAALLIPFAIYTETTTFSPGTRVAVRNFYGTLRVTDTGSGTDALRTLLHGIVNHGGQFQEPALRRRPNTYFGPQSGVGILLQNAATSPRRVGIIGLGTGTLAAYGQPGDYFRFYEINPLVEKLARAEFSFLSDSAARVEVVLGDARLSLENEPDQTFDVLVLDAFSGDAVPVHLLTREAFQLYLRHIKTDGVLAIHISNSYLDLRPVVQKLTAATGLEAIIVDSPEDKANHLTRAFWVIASANREFRQQPVFRAGVPLVPKPRMPIWTDNYSNLASILK